MSPSRCGRSRNLGPPKRNSLGCPTYYQPGHLLDSLCGSTIDFEIHLSGQDAKKMRMVQDVSLSLLMFKGMGEDWSDKVSILV